MKPTRTEEWAEMVMSPLSGCARSERWRFHPSPKWDGGRAVPRDEAPAEPTAAEISRALRAIEGNVHTDRSDA